MFNFMKIFGSEENIDNDDDIESSGLLSSFKNNNNDNNNNECCNSLSWTNRIMGFTICLAIGILLNIMSTFNAPMVAISPAKFAIPYTLGNITSIMSTMFLMGPWKQLTAMFDRRRLLATICYFTSMILTLRAVFKHSSRPQILILICIQTCAFIWYSLSYIPYGQEMLIKSMSCLFSPAFEDI